MVRHPTKANMGFWGNSNSSLDFGSKGAYEEIRGYVESKIGLMDVNDSNLQDKLLTFLGQEEKDISGWRHIFSVWDSRKGDLRPVELEIKHVGKDTYIRGLTSYDINSVRTNLKRLGFSWSHEQKTWLLKNRLITIDEIKEFIKEQYPKNCTKGLRTYCEKIAYLQSSEGMPNKFTGQTTVTSVSGDSKDKVDISASNSSKNPYSKIEQLEKLIEMRNKGKIDAEEFKSLKRELLT